MTCETPHRPSSARYNTGLGIRQNTSAETLEVLRYD